MKMALLFLCVITLSLTNLCQAENHNVKPQALSYTNARYGFTLHLPPWFYVAKEADNGDGITITDPTVLEIHAYGTMAISPSQSLGTLAKEWSERIGHITKSVFNRKEQYFIFHGIQRLPRDSEHTQLFIAVKVLYGQNAHSVLRITYHGEANKNYAHIIETAVNSFTRKHP